MTRIAVIAGVVASFGAACSDPCSRNLSGHYSLMGCTAATCSVTQESGQCGFRMECDFGISCMGQLSGANNVSLSCSAGFGNYSGAGTVDDHDIWSLRLMTSSGTSCDAHIQPL